MDGLLNFVTDQFGNREIAIAVWSLLLLMWVLFKAHKPIGRSVYQLLKLLFGKKIFPILLIFLAYISLLILGLAKIGVWNASDHLKVTIAWTMTVALVMFFNLSEVSKEGFFRKKVKEAFAFTILLEFIIGFYPFSLPVELVIMPITMAVVLLRAFSETDQKYSAVKKILDVFLGIIGLILLGQAVRGLAANLNDFANTTWLIDLLLPPVLTVLILPFIYFLAVYSAYELLFVRLNFFNRDSKLLWYAKFRAFIRFGLNAAKLNKWSKQTHNLRVSSKRDVIELIG